IQQNRDPIGYTKRTRRYPPIKRVESCSEECSPKSSLSNPNESAEDAFLMYLTRVEGLAQTLRLSRFTSNSHLIQAVTSPCLLVDENFMAVNSQVGPAGCLFNTIAVQ
ncbi:hypothetical protein ANCDUO_20489, partial [Ancylostoma duodenale]